MLIALDLKNYSFDEICKTFQRTNSKRQHRLNKSVKSKASTQVLELLQCDLQILIFEKCLGWAMQMLPVLDDASGLSKARLLKS